MKNLVILGAGTAGTMTANRFRRALDSSEWCVTIVEKDENHYYQPGFLFIPFGIYDRSDVVKTGRDLLSPGVRVIAAAVDRIEPAINQVRLGDGTILPYDFLVVATGAGIRPEQTEGLKGDLWHKQIFDFYTLEGACALAEFFKSWNGGTLVVNIAEMPIKCPVAPLEFAFLADAYFTERGIRDKVDIHFVTPLPGAFTKHRASVMLGHFLAKKNIRVTAEFNIARVDNAARTIVSWDDTVVPFDVLVTVPVNMGDEAIARSGMGDELNFIPTDRGTLRAKDHANIFVIGDATNLPVSKAGSVVHYQSDILFENLLGAAAGRPLEAQFDGHANCFIESGFGKGILIDFNYETEPLPGKFPFPGVGPFSLLEETTVNHCGKMLFRWAYWNVLLKGLDLPGGSAMSMAGKRT